MSTTLVHSNPFTPIHSTNSNLTNIPVANGQFIVATDTKVPYLDNGNSRIRLSDIIPDTYSSITGGTTYPFPQTDKIYFATDTHQLLQAEYDTNSDIIWHELGNVQSEIVVNSNAIVSIELQDNKIYYLTNNNITSITLTASASLNYCTLCFTAGSSGTTFSQPSGSRCIGYDCSGGIFSPVAGREYQIAVDVLNNVLTLYVINTRLDGGNSEGETVIVENSNAAVSLTLDNNTMYRCTNSAITGITLNGVVSGFKYATVIFTCGSTAATFAMPENDWYCVGAGCSGGEFTPVADMRYNLAIENEIDRIAVYVMEAL